MTRPPLINLPSTERGLLYRKGDPRPEPPKDSDFRTATLERLREIRAAAFDQDTENTARTLLAVMDWHKPWAHWRQLLRPAYIGDVYLGTGCRSCGPGPADCATVREIGQQLGIEP